MNGLCKPDCTSDIVVTSAGLRARAQNTGDSYRINTNRTPAHPREQPEGIVDGPALRQPTHHRCERHLVRARHPVEQPDRVGDAPALRVHAEKPVLNELVPIEADLDGKPMAAPPVIERGHGAARA